MVITSDVSTYAVYIIFMQICGRTFSEKKNLKSVYFSNHVQSIRCKMFKYTLNMTKKKNYKKKKKKKRKKKRMNAKLQFFETCVKKINRYCFVICSMKKAAFFVFNCNRVRDASKIRQNHFIPMTHYDAL